MNKKQIMYWNTQGRIQPGQTANGVVKKSFEHYFFDENNDQTNTLANCQFHNVDKNQNLIVRWFVMLTIIVQ